MENKIRRIIYFIFLAVLFSGLNLGQAQEPIPARLSEVYFKSTEDIESLFKEKLSLGDSVFYTKVPRGLIVSIDSLIFFNEGDDEILESSKPALRTIAKILKEIENDCVIESNTYADCCQKSEYQSNWELSTVRAGKIADYLIKVENIPAEKIRAIGFGDIMPFYNYLEHASHMDRRIDFVIINYEEVFPLN